ncbi:MAG: M81 family metallopeptidase, partial [Motilibacteraceae bacterium]
MYSTYRTAPHIDVEETMRRAVKMLMESLKTGVKPILLWAPIPVVLPGERTSTVDEPAKSLYDRLPGIDAIDGVWDASLMVGYVWADEPRAGLGPAGTGAQAPRLSGRVLTGAQPPHLAGDPVTEGPADARVLGAAERPPGRAAGWAWTGPVVDPVRRLRALTARLEAAGGTLTRAALPALPERPDVVVDATGLAARALVPDDTVQPVRLEWVHVAGVDVEHWAVDLADPARPVQVAPVEGGAVVTRTEVGTWDLTARAQDAQELLARAAALEPRLGAARPAGHRVALLGARPAPRVLTTPRTDGCPVVHCYGLGPAVWSLAWGAAGDVVAAVTALETSGAPA